MSRTEKLKMHLDERMIRWGFVCQQINHAYSQLHGLIASHTVLY